MEHDTDQDILDNPQFNDGELGETTRRTSTEVDIDELEPHFERLLDLATD